MKILDATIIADPVVGPTGADGHGSTRVSIHAELQGYEMAAIDAAVKSVVDNRFERRRELILDVATGRKIVKLELIGVPQPNPLGTAE